MNTRTKTISLLLTSNLLFIALLFILEHTWYIGEVGTDIAKTIYPRFYFLAGFIGQSSETIFTYSTILQLLLNLFLLFRLITLYQDKTTAILFFSTIAVTLVAAEITLRMLGYVPGLESWSIHSFHPVGKLTTQKGFFADEKGILKIDSTSRDELVRNIAQKQTKLTLNQAGEVYELANDAINIISRKTKNDLADLYFKILQKPQNRRTEWETAIVNYIQSPINTDGFRSIEFRKYNHTKPSLLLLGDSFTWGHSAKNKTNSFADILLSKGYVVYNTGITTTDVAQYLAVAEKYIPELQPDFVIVNFYIGNDISYFKREVLPYHPTFYCTNAGYLLSCPHGNYLSKNDAYDLAMTSSQIPVNSQSILVKLLMKTVIGTRLYKAALISGSIYFFPYLAADNLIENKNLTIYYREIKKNKYPTPYSNQELQQIKNIAEKYNSSYILSSIPDFSKGYLITTKDYPDLFGGIPFSEMKVEQADYQSGSLIHFNEQGHRKYANFLDSLIQMTQK